MSLLIKVAIISLGINREIAKGSNRKYVNLILTGYMAPVGTKQRNLRLYPKMRTKKLMRRPQILNLDRSLNVLGG